MQLCAVSSFYPHGINKRWRWGECLATKHLCPLNSWNRQCHPSRTCPQLCQLSHTDCLFWCVHAQLDTQCIVSWQKKAQEVAMDMPVLLPSVWTHTGDAPWALCLFMFMSPWADSLVNNTNGPALVISLSPLFTILTESASPLQYAALAHEHS